MPFRNLQKRKANRSKILKKMSFHFKQKVLIPPMRHFVSKLHIYVLFLEYFARYHLKISSFFARHKLPNEQLHLGFPWFSLTYEPLPKLVQLFKS